MKWPVRPVPLESLTRNIASPYFDYADDARTYGSPYLLGDDGFFVVGGRESVLPEFIVDLKLPKKMHAGYYPVLSSILREYSSGHMWFDFDNYDAMDLCWRLGLHMKVSAPLMAWDNDSQDFLLEAGYRVHRVDNCSDIAIALKIARTYLRPNWEYAILDRCIAAKHAYLLGNQRMIAGVGVIRSQDSDCASCSLILLPEFRNMDIGIWFGAAIAKDAKRKCFVSSVSNEHPGSLKACLAAGLKPVKYSATVALVGCVQGSSVK